MNTAVFINYCLHIYFHSLVKLRASYNQELCPEFLAHMVSYKMEETKFKNKNKKQPIGT